MSKKTKRPKHDACDAHSEATDCGDCKKEPDEASLRCLATCVSTKEQCKRSRRSDFLTCTQHDNTFDPSEDDNFFIGWASEVGYVELVRLMLRDPRVDPTAMENLAIRWASYNGHVEVVRLLLEWKGAEGQRVDPTHFENEAIRMASQGGHKEVVALLLKWRGANGEKVVDPASNVVTLSRGAGLFPTSSAGGLTMRARPVHTSSAAAAGGLTTGLVETTNSTEVGGTGGGGGGGDQSSTKPVLLSINVEDVTKHDTCDANSDTNCRECQTAPDDASLRCLATCTATDQRCKRLRRSDLLTCTQHDNLGTYDPSADKNYSIRWASELGYVEVVRLLLRDPRVDPTAMENFAIRWASELGHVEVVRLLLGDPRVDPTAKENEAILWASRNGHAEVVRLLLKWKGKRVNPTTDNNKAILWASQGGHKEVVALLLKWRGVNGEKVVDPTSNAVEDVHVVKLAYKTDRPAQRLDLGLAITRGETLVVRELLAVLEDSSSQPGLASTEPDQKVYIDGGGNAASVIGGELTSFYLSHLKLAAGDPPQLQLTEILPAKIKQSSSVTVVAKGHVHVSDSSRGDDDEHKEVFVKIAFIPSVLNNNNSLEIERHLYLDWVPYMAQCTPNLLGAVGVWRCPRLEQKLLGLGGNNQVATNLGKAIMALRRKGGRDDYDFGGPAYMLVTHRAGGVTLKTLLNAREKELKARHQKLAAAPDVAAAAAAAASTESERKADLAFRVLLQHVLLQVALTLMVFEQFGVMHHDLHHSNVFVEILTTPRDLHYEVPGPGGFVEVLTTPYLVKIYDLDHATKTATEYSPKQLNNTLLEKSLCGKMGECNKFTTNFDWFTLLSFVRDDLPSDLEALNLVHALINSDLSHVLTISQSSNADKTGLLPHKGRPCLCSNSKCSKCDLATDSLRMMKGPKHFDTKLREVYSRVPVAGAQPYELLFNEPIIQHHHITPYVLAEPLR